MSEKRFFNPMYGAYVAVAAACLLLVYFWFAPAASSKSQPQKRGELAIVPPKALPSPDPVLRSPQGAGRVRVGIVSGHSGFDSGAVCPDGLTEESINRTVAGFVVAQLQSQGIPTDLLDEFDPALQGYTAAALVSIHTDSCIYPEATGFKVASLEGSSNPENRMLVDCLVQAYGERTGLALHENSITYDMTQYHAFTDIAVETPGAIIEIGFMLTDRDLLTGQPGEVAGGIVDGILCFLNARHTSR